MEKKLDFSNSSYGSGIHIEAKGLGVSIRAPFEPNDNPMIAADGLILREEKNRKSLYNSWKFKAINKN